MFKINNFIPKPFQCCFSLDFPVSVMLHPPDDRKTQESSLIFLFTGNPTNYTFKLDLKTKIAPYL